MFKDFESAKTLAQISKILKDIDSKMSSLILVSKKDLLNKTKGDK